MGNKRLTANHKLLLSRIYVGYRLMDMAYSLSDPKRIAAAPDNVRTWMTEQSFPQECGNTFYTRDEEGAWVPVGEKSVGNYQMILLNDAHALLYPDTNMACAEKNPNLNRARVILCDPHALELGVASTLVCKSAELSVVM